MEDNYVDTSDINRNYIEDFEVFICDKYLYMFEKFIYEQNIELLKKISKKYKINLEVLIANFTKKPIKNHSKIQKPCNFSKIDNKSRCEARTWDHGRGTRCSRKKYNNSNYCKTHFDFINTEGSLKLGHYLENDIRNFKKDKLIIYSIN